jgi:transcription antitermination factor NusG
VVAYIGENAVRAVAADLCALDFRAYCPLGARIDYRARVGGKRAQRVRQFPVFGGYLFVGEVVERLSKSTHDQIVAILGDSSGPLALRAEAIAAINGAELAGRWDSTVAHRQAPPFRKGDRVRINAGLFAGFLAIIARLPTDLRVSIDIEMHGRATRVVIDARTLEPAP